MQADVPHIESRQAPSVGRLLLLEKYRRLLPGLLLALAIALVSIEVGHLPVFQAQGISALTLAIVFGMVAGNSFYGRLASRCESGVHFSRQNLLRLGIVLYGFRLTFLDIGHVGWAGIVIDALVLSSTFGLALLLGVKLLGLDRESAMLIGAGSSICGAAAVMATAPVLRARSEQVAIAVATVVAFGTIAIFLYPLLYRLNAHGGLLPMSSSGFGIYIGSTVHEVAQVVAAGRSISQEAADAAVIAKMVRVMMLAPFLIALSFAWKGRSMRSAAEVDSSTKRKLAIPWFAFAFIAMVGFNSLGWLAPSVLVHINDADTLLLSMAMAALGLCTHIGAVRRAGLRPLVLAGLLFFWLVCGGAVINCLIERLMS
jgi:uncharacterized integral membrane protein (TIGR00698 family)